uniref:FEKKY domain-containing protein n=1 Tax=Flavobacterium sp. TaxID=239 RepID=UPI00404A2628
MMNRIRQKKSFKVIFLLIFLGLKSSLIYSQNTDENNPEILHFYTYGLPDFEEEYNHICKNKLNEKYGFDYQMIAGCVVKMKDVKKWNRHNKKIEKKLKKRNGKNWRQAYEIELKKCLINND